MADQTDKVKVGYAWVGYNKGAGDFIVYNPAEQAQKVIVRIAVHAAEPGREAHFSAGVLLVNYMVGFPLDTEQARYHAILINEASRIAEGVNRVGISISHSAVGVREIEVK